MCFVVDIQWGMYQWGMSLSDILTCSVYEVTIRGMVDVLTVSVLFWSCVLYVVAGLGDCSLLELRY
jgi:hypothetical protein